MAMEKRIFGSGETIQKQIVLPWSKAVEISFKSLAIRFWRSLITMSGVILAIAFLMSVWTNNRILYSLKHVPKTDENHPRVMERLVKQQIEVDEEAEAAGLDPKDKWLISLSLLVCVVGIVNAMLMSVTERIREIGTMKCLGALDEFIIKLFLLESSFQGILGTLIGIVLGFVLSFGRSWLAFGGFTFSYFPAGDILASAVYSLLIGTLLSVFAAIFPAYRAAKMQPVDAMRVEE